MKNKSAIFRALFLPAVWGYIDSLINLWVKKDAKSLYIYLFLYIVILAYWCPTYDTMGRFGATLNQIEFSDFFNGDPLLKIVTFLNPIIDAYYCFAFIWFFGLLFFYKACVQAYGKESKFPTIMIIVLLFGVNVTYICSLTFYTISATFSLYFFEKYSNKYLRYVPLLFISYFLHPGVLMIVPAALCLHYLYNKDYNVLAIVFVVGYYIIFHMIMNSSLPLFYDLLEVNQMDGVLNSFNNYTSDASEWGQNFRDFGIKGVLWDFMLYMFFSVVALLSVISFKRIKRDFSFACFVIGIVVLINVYGFYTMTERTTIFTYFSALITLIAITKENKVKTFVLNFVMSLVVSLYFLAFMVFPQPRKHFFKDYVDSYFVSGMTFIIPNVLTTFDLHHFGFSDAYLDENNVGGRYKRDRSNSF